jgi:hypothetical protein
LDQFGKHVVGLLFFYCFLTGAGHFKPVRVVVTVLDAVFLGTVVAFEDFAFL